jgi:hypothetical protein
VNSGIQNNKIEENFGSKIRVNFLKKISFAHPRKVLYRRPWSEQEFGYNQA